VRTAPQLDGVGDDLALTSDARIPGVPIVMLSDTAIVLNSKGFRPLPGHRR